MELDILAIPPDVLDRLRVVDDAGNRPENLVSGAERGYPLRCCLRRSRPGERLLLASYAPVRRRIGAADTGPGSGTAFCSGTAFGSGPGSGPGPYDERGPVFVHADRCGGPESPAWPEELRGTRRVLRCYSPQGRILGGCLLDSPARTRLAERTAGDLLLDPAVAFVQVRAVEFGCFLFDVTRAHTRDEPAVSTG